MIELRWVNRKEAVDKIAGHVVWKVTKVLQQRHTDLMMDASGAFCGHSDWSDWQDVPEVEDE